MVKSKKFWAFLTANASLAAVVWWVVLPIWQGYTFVAGSLYVDDSGPAWFMPTYLAFSLLGLLTIVGTFLLTNVKIFDHFSTPKSGVMQPAPLEVPLVQKGA